MTKFFKDSETAHAYGVKGILKAARGIRAKGNTERRGKWLQEVETLSKQTKPFKNIKRQYPIILADPPWRFEIPLLGGYSRAIDNHYPTMALKDICALPVEKIAAKDAMLYMWTTAPKLAESMEVVTAWGFVYRTCMVWVKDKIGMGHHVRNQHELLLICRRGKMVAPIRGEQPSSVLIAPRTAHSAKPIAIYKMIEHMYPELGKIELFARGQRDGWDTWGNMDQKKKGFF